MKRPENIVKLNPSSLPPILIFLLLEEVARRWRRAPVTTGRLLKKFNVPVYRLTHGGPHLYALADIERIEEQARDRPPLPARSNLVPPQMKTPKAGKEEALRPDGEKT